MKRKVTLPMIGCILVIAMVLGAGVLWIVEDNRQMEAFIAETDRFIEQYERYDYEKYKEMETVSSQNEQAGLENEEAQKAQELSEVYVTEVHAYPDPTTAQYEEPATDWNLYEEYNKLDWVTWQDCVQAASELGMDEYTLMLSTGWTVNEGYVWYDLYLAYLCAMCPIHYWANGEYVPDKLAGWDFSGTYSEENLLYQSYNVSQAELRIIYLSLKYPRYDIFGCDGLSWYYNATLIYESYVEGYIIRVWAY